MVNEHGMPLLPPQSAVMSRRFVALIARLAKFVPPPPDAFDGKGCGVMSIPTLTQPALAAMS